MYTQSTIRPTFVIRVGIGSGHCNQFLPVVLKELVFGRVSSESLEGCRSHGNGIYVTYSNTPPVMAALSE